MSQHYRDPARENDPHALPDIEVFHMTASDYHNNHRMSTNGPEEFNLIHADGYALRHRWL